MPNGWLEPVPLREDAVLVADFIKKNAANPTNQSLIQPFPDQVIKWRQEGIWGATVHEALIASGFTGR